MWRFLLRYLSNIDLNKSTYNLGLSLSELDREIALVEGFVDQQSYLISFENASAAEANRYAENLRNALLDAIPEIQVERKRHDLTAQDAGQQLLIQILTSPATGTIGGAILGLFVTTITKWISRYPNASLTFRRPQGDIITTGINNRTVVKLTKLLLEKEESEKNK